MHSPSVSLIMAFATFAGGLLTFAATKMNVGLPESAARSCLVAASTGGLCLVFYFASLGMSALARDGIM
jgi:hypothetical protein